MKQLLLIGLILGLTNCTTSQLRLADNETFRSTFTQAEIQDLQLLFDFFNRSICIDSKELDDCYRHFFERSYKLQQTGSLDINVPYQKQQKIYDNIDTSTFKQIWYLGWSIFNDVPHDNSNDTMIFINLNVNGKYMDFLRAVGKDDKVINHYYETIKSAGDLTPSLIGGMIMNYEYYNIKDLRIKFIVAIHYLTLNDQTYRKERKNSG